MGKKDDHEKKTLFRAKMELTDIGMKTVKFRVTQHDGLGILDLHHIHVDRNNFPRDDNFSLDFINRKIVIPDTPPKPGKDAMKVDVMEYEKTMQEIGSIKRMKDKQAQFRKLKTMKIMITED